ncbi:aspartate/glutamate racemase family protein [Paucilactobacillus kaifaensis]|uniref:aspartate/glutamate racemase family protein n=1 Tax=Paucilactobacillus kaifaensis TaxID=2559921 RepID=UPI0010F8D499|nr:amino acid racemase [Paucilactobacillus kaifaensis]
MDNFFTILGGMGSLATESFVRLLNERTPSSSDQDYLDYLVVNHATIPDRSSYIMDHSQTNPLPSLLADIKQQSKLNPSFFVLTCNSAHYFYPQMQNATSIPMLHMPKLAVEQIKVIAPTAHRVGILGTPGSINNGIYDGLLTNNGYEPVKPTPSILAATEKLIFTDIKQNGHVNAAHFHALLAQMQTELNCDVIILGCTELSLAQEKAPDHPYHVIDAQSILADKTVSLGLKLQKGAGKNVRIS